MTLTVLAAPPYVKLPTQPAPAAIVSVALVRFRLSMGAPALPIVPATLSDPPDMVIVPVPTTVDLTMLPAQTTWPPRRFSFPVAVEPAPVEVTLARDTFPACTVPLAPTVSVPSALADGEVPDITPMLIVVASSKP